MSATSSTTVTLASLGLLAAAGLLAGCSFGLDNVEAAGGAGAATTGAGGAGGAGATGTGGDGAGGAGGSTAVGGTGGAGGADTGGAGPCEPDGNFPDEDLGTGVDPAGGAFTMDEALAGLPEGSGPLRAVITTDLGVLTCELRPDVAPNGVANFVGLARGQRPWRDSTIGHWVKRVFYDGLLFHRVIPEFMAQGGDPLGTGYGGPGYEFDDEIGALSHVPGTLAYANSGPNSNGSQFYVTEVDTSFLDGDYTIIGLCEPVSVVQALTGVVTDGDPPGGENKPLVDLHMQTIRITRCAP